MYIHMCLVAVPGLCAEPGPRSASRVEARITSITVLLNFYYYNY